MNGSVHGLWGYAEADPIVVGVLVAAILAIAVVFVVTRVRRRRRGR